MANVSKMPASLTADKSPEEIAWLQSIEKAAFLETPFDVDPITPGNTTATVTSRTVTDSANAGPGVDSGILGWSGVTQTLYDSFTTIEAVLNTFNTNQANLNAAIAALNARVTALEEKTDEIITALSP